MSSQTLRQDLQQIANLIPENSRVLDLGCGDGYFMQYLVKEKNVNATGIEINQDKIFKCLDKSLNVINANLDEGLALFERNMFDFVILNETLQVLQNPIDLLKEMLRVGKHCIVGINNFGYWRVRLDLLFRGRMPKSDSLPYEWYNTPNIHLCTLKDFEKACDQNGINVQERIFFKRAMNHIALNDGEYGARVLKGGFKPFFNLFSSYGIYLINSESS